MWICAVFTRTLFVRIYDHERRKGKDLGFVYSLAQNKDILLGSTSVCMDSVFARAHSCYQRQQLYRDSDAWNKVPINI